MEKEFAKSVGTLMIWRYSSAKQHLQAVPYSHCFSDPPDISMSQFSMH